MPLSKSLFRGDHASRSAVLSQIREQYGYGPGTLAMTAVRVADGAFLVDYLSKFVMVTYAYVFSTPSCPHGHLLGVLW